MTKKSNKIQRETSEYAYFPFETKARKIDQELINACYFGNNDLVKKLIGLGANVEYIEERFKNQLKYFKLFTNSEYNICNSKYHVINIP